MHYSRPRPLLAARALLSHLAITLSISRDSAVVKSAAALAHSCGRAVRSAKIRSASASADMQECGSVYGPPIASAPAPVASMLSRATPGATSARTH